jgi:hypothetical protein
MSPKKHQKKQNVFLHVGVSINGDTQKWMVCKEKSIYKWLICWGTSISSGNLHVTQLFANDLIYPADSPRDLMPSASPRFS